MGAIVGMGVDVGLLPSSKHPITDTTNAIEISELTETIAIRAFIASCSRLLASAQMTWEPPRGLDCVLLASATASCFEPTEGARNAPMSEDRCRFGLQVIATALAMSKLLNVCYEVNMERFEKSNAFNRNQDVLTVDNFAHRRQIWVED